MKGIAVANLLYCSSTMVLVFVYYHGLTTYGLTYFLLELLVVIVLVAVELKAVSVN